MLARALVSGIAVVCLAMPAHADDKMSDKADKTASEAHAKGISTVLVSDKCGSTQDIVTLTVTFKIKGDTFGDTKKQFNDKVQQLEDTAKKQKTGKFEQQTLNYNIALSNHAVSDDTVTHGLYNLSGSVSYRLDSADTAIKMAEFLKDEKFHVGVNENKFIVQCNPTE